MRRVGAQPNFLALGVDAMHALVTTTRWPGQFLLDPWGSGGALLSGRYQPVEAPGLRDGTGVIGDTNALTLIVRDPVGVVVGTESDDLIRNMVTVLAEWRGTLAVRQLVYVVIIDLPS